MSKIEESFTTRMRKETRKNHSLSDALVNAKFVLSLNDETVWAGGLFVFYHVFSFLEDIQKTLNLQDYNDLFVNDALFRKQAFEEDLDHYYRGTDWRNLPKAPELENYLGHLQTLERENPKLLMAYVYHLYMGVLSGGQILIKKRKIFPGAAKTGNEHTDKVTDFSTVNIPQLKKDVQEAMNKIAAKMSEDEKKAFIDESNNVFTLNNTIISTVGGQNEVFSSFLSKTSVIILIVLGAVFSYKMGLKNYLLPHS